jgi:hypothetical protein
MLAMSFVEGKTLDLELKGLPCEGVLVQEEVA